MRQTLDTKWEYNQAVHQLFVDFNKTCDLVRRAVLYNILIEFGIALKLVRPIKIVSKLHLSQSPCRQTFVPIKNGLKRGDALSPLLFNFPLEYAIRRI
jgi:hypothetical protein